VSLGPLIIANAHTRYRQKHTDYYTVMLLVPTCHLEHHTNMGQILSRSDASSERVDMVPCVLGIPSLTSPIISDGPRFECCPSLRAADPSLQLMW
jgi:hypothetical protein